MLFTQIKNLKASNIVLLKAVNLNSIASQICCVGSTYEVRNLVRQCWVDKELVYKILSVLKIAYKEVSFTLPTITLQGADAAIC